MWSSVPPAAFSVMGQPRVMATPPGPASGQKYGLATAEPLLYFATISSPTRKEMASSLVLMATTPGSAAGAEARNQASGTSTSASGRSLRMAGSPGCESNAPSVPVEAIVVTGPAGQLARCFTSVIGESKPGDWGKN